MSPNVVTLIAGAETSLVDAHLLKADEALRQAGAHLGDAAWLAAGTACDLPFEGIAAAVAVAAVRTALAGAAIDVAAQPARARRKRLLLADMESTLIRNEMLDELADFLGKRQEVAEITRAAMNGEIDFAAALTQRVALLAGQPVRLLEAAAERIALMPGAEALVATMRAGGAVTAIVSGGFTYFAEPVRQRLGCEIAVANTLMLADGRISGTVAEPILTKDGKLETLHQLARDRRIDLGETLAVGDGANDLPMIEAAGLGVAFRAKPNVAARAPVRIDHADLTALLYLQGYRADEIVRC